ncbi:MAG: methyltransferase domain-containing protein [Planctomycetes bacterium]|nr:methyltransferase domain-containing protein [Planctomycetota bacterium]
MLAQRDRQPEIMDRPDLDEGRHRDALCGLGRLNAISRSSAAFWPDLHALARREAPRPLRVLDVASGGGDVPLALARRARSRGLCIDIDGCDVSPLAVEFANRRAAQVCDVRFFQLDVLKEPLPRGYDAVTCSLFLHHLSQPQAESLLREMSRAGRLVLVSDLRRSRAGYALAWLACRLLTRSPVVHEDGPRSVAAAFTRKELLELARRSGLAGASVSRRWPQRLLLKWMQA